MAKIVLKGLKETEKFGERLGSLYKEEMFFFNR